MKMAKQNTRVKIIKDMTRPDRQSATSMPETYEIIAFFFIGQILLSLSFSLGDSGLGYFRYFL